MNLGFPGGPDSKESPEMQETRVLSLGGEDPLEKEMGTHSSILAWRILWTEKPGGVQSLGFQKTGGASGKESACQCKRSNGHRFNPWVGKIPWRRKWEPTPVFLPGKSHGQRSLLGYTVHGIPKRVQFDLVTETTTIVVYTVINSVGEGRKGAWKVEGNTLEEAHLN